MSMKRPTITYNEDIMSKYEETYLDFIDNGIFGVDLVKSMRTQFGTRALPMLIALCGDGDFYLHTLFSQFQLRSLVRAAYDARSTNMAVDRDFMSKLKDRAFWRLNRSQMLKLKTELTYLFPTKFAFLHNWEDELHTVGISS